MLAMWLLDLPHHAICLPVAIVLAVRLRRSAMVIAVLLAVIFCRRIAFELPRTPVGSADWRFLCAIAGIHTAVLVGATPYIAHRLRLRAGPVDAREIEGHRTSG
jgi:hypothetical protein